jgi:hypothetical protein
VSCKRQLRPSDSEVAPGRLLLRFSLHSGPAAGRLARIGALGGGKYFGIGVGAYIGFGQFVRALPASFQIGGQFVPGQERTFLNADAVGAKHCDVRRDRDLLRKASVSAHVEPIYAEVLSLVKAEIPDLQEFPFRAIENRLNLQSIATSAGSDAAAFSVASVSRSDSVGIPAALRALISLRLAALSVWRSNRHISSSHAGP